MSDVIALDARDHVSALDRDGAVWCWGDNDDGQGDGRTASVDLAHKRHLADRHRPHRVAGIGPVVDVSVGASHSCSWNQAGQVLCWGRNRRGQLGAGGRYVRRRPSPVVITEAKR